MNPAAAATHALPVTLDRHPGETSDSWLERLAEANQLTHPQLLRTLAVAPESHRRSAGTAPDGWAPGRCSQLCPACLTDTGTWAETWRHPMTTACLTHRCFLHAVCPTCGLRFRSHPHHRLRSVDAPAGTCGNPAGHRGRPCPQPLIDLSCTPAPDGVLASQERTQGAIDGQAIRVLDERSPADVYLSELKAIVVLLLHLATQPGAEALARWTTCVRREAARSLGPRTARWGLAPPADPRARGHALAAADRILAAADVEEAAELLHPWTDLTPAVPEGQLGWLADHTAMTPRLTRLIVAATATRRRVATLLRQPISVPVPLTVIPQVLPADLYVEHLAGHLAVTETTGRLFASLCLVRRGRQHTAWTDAARLLGLDDEIGTKTPRACSARLVIAPGDFVQAVDAVGVRLRGGSDYRNRETVVRRLANRTRWYPAWSREHHSGSPTTSRRHAVTWLWTQYAAGHLDTSPGWDTTPTANDRAHYRRYADRLTPQSRAALIALATAH